METFDTKDVEWIVNEPFKESPWGPLIAYNPKTKKMEEIRPPYSRIDENGSTWYVFEKPITGITIGTF